MATSNIKLFDENKGNMLSDSEFNISTQRLNGLQTGVASSQLQNKAMYQASLVAYAIAQIMMQNGKNANDTDAVSAFVANLSGTMLQKVYDLATVEEAKAGTATGKWMSPALVKAVIDERMLKVYPVGSIYMSVNSADPGTFIGGTWQRIKDVFLLSAGDTYGPGTTGGEATHKLTVAEMPSHTHSFNRAYDNGTIYGQIAWENNGRTTKTFTTNATGDNGAHNNMPPYLTVYMWKRTA